jgi:hypothetical protein
MKVLVKSSLLLAILHAAPASAEPATGSRIDTAPRSVSTHDIESDNAAVRVMNKFARCVANRDRTKTAALLAMPYLSPEQTKSIYAFFDRDDACLGIGDRELRFKPPVVLGGLAEGLIFKTYKKIDVARFAGMTDETMDAAGLAPRNVWEDFGQCLVRRDPALAFDLMESTPASPGETAAVGKLKPHLGLCLIEGNTLNLTPMAIRSIVAVGLHRMLTASSAGRGS